MKRIIFYLAAISVILTSCDTDILNKEHIGGKGVLVSEERTITAFTSIESRIGADCNIIESDTYSVHISIQANLLPYLKTTVSNGTLIITFGNYSIQSDSTITIDIYTPSVKKISLTGAGNIESELPIETISISGTGNITCKGEIEKVWVYLTGVGNVDLFTMPVNKAHVNVSGVGNIKINAQSVLNITISGIGDVYYKGQPSITSKISGLGAIVNNN